MKQQKLSSLREWMSQEGIDWYYIPTGDYHQSEYTSEFFKLREYISGFTGSNGTLLVSQKEAGLWTDGRYFIQAEKELSGTGITLFKMLEEGVPALAEYLEAHMKSGEVLGFDGRVVSTAKGLELKEIAARNQAAIIYDQDYGEIGWKTRPQLSSNPIRVLTEAETGSTISQKLNKVRQKMIEEGCECHLLTKLDDIMWLFQIRGSDISCNPLALSYAWITLEEVYLFTRVEVMLPGVQNLSYDEIDTFVAGAAIKYQGKKVLFDENFVNYKLYSILKKNCKMHCAQNPTTMHKAVKNETELSHTRSAHIKEGVAFTKFIKYLKQNVQTESITETHAAQILESFREEQKGYCGVSFPTISAFGANAAMMHYEARKGKESKLQPKGLYLVDAGGQYVDGTTDTTRTIALGEISKELKLHTTAVVRAMLRLANAHFLYGCTGQNLDILARGVLWDMDLDYKCGTGHGVGHMLCVHEGPQGFRWKQQAGKVDAVLEAGMVITDEPGIYQEGSHGIRIENELVCQKGVKNQDGQFMYFEVLTFVPIDLDAIDVSLLNETEKNQLNGYHRQVYEKLSEYLSEEECIWLKKYTEPIY